MRTFFWGFWLSVPAAGLMWAGLMDGTNNSWYYFGAAAFLGLPTNLGFLGGSFPLLAVIGSPLGWNGWLIIAGSLAGSAIAGAHVNGMGVGFLVKRKSRDEATAEAPTPQPSRSRWLLWLLMAVVVAGLAYVTFRYS